jgi:galactonate dehydratase
LWFEEPVPPDNFPALAEVARATSIPVATGERLTTKAEFAAALAHGARILQPALGRAGGIWEAKKIAILAEAAGAQMAPHLYAGPVEWAANVHLAVSCPNILMVEAIESPFHEALVTGRPKVENGFVAAPRRRGWGSNSTRTLRRPIPVTADRLHLEMQEAPCDWQNGNNFAGGSAD